MAAEVANVLYCKICHKEFPPGTTGLCPDDSGELVSDSLIGMLFADKYEILSLLGEGGMSRVYKARHTFMNRVVAIKLLHESAKDAVSKARFQQEAEAASALSHPNVVTVHDFGLTAAGQAYFIMDCLEGKSLADILDEKGSLPIQQAVDIFTQACEGLDHAHRKGIIHRDVKPSNLIVIRQEDGHDLVKLVDFGIAKLMTPGGTLAQQKRITQTGEVFGTPAYMSPEQCNGRDLDARSDIYSFGCLMYEVLAGEPPLYGDTFVATVMKHVSHLPTPLSEKIPAKVPPDLEAAIMKCLEKDPDKRFHSAQELKQALFDAAFVAGLKGLRVGAVPVPRALAISGGGSAADTLLVTGTTKRLRKRNSLAMAVLSLLGLSAFSWLLFSYPGPESDYGTYFDKFKWQAQTTFADHLMHEHKYDQAIVTLESSVELAKKFRDDNRRLETDLTILLDAYVGTNNAEKVEQVNKQLVCLADNRVYTEFEFLMARLKQWEQPNTSAVQWEERAQQATAFGERIAHCADKLSARSRQKQEALLKRAVHAFDNLNLREGVYRSLFRIQLAEIYRSQQRFDDQREILEEAFEHSAKNPQTALGWRYKILAHVMLGELNCNNAELNKARPELENALAWTRVHLANDRELLRSSLNALSHLYRAYHKKDYDMKADALAKEAKLIGDKLDSDSAKF